MVEMKGKWLKLPSYRDVNALVHKKQGSFIKRMFLDALSQNRSSQSWEDSGKDDKGCWPSAIPYFGMRWWEGEHSAIMVKRPGAFQDRRRVRQNRKSDRKINPFFRIWGEFHYSFNVESKNLDQEKKVGRMPWIKYFLFLRQSCGTGRLICGLLRLTLKWPLKANHPPPPVKLFCKSKWLDVPGHCSIGQTVLMTVHHL